MGKKKTYCSSCKYFKTYREWDGMESYYRRWKCLNPDAWVRIDTPLKIEYDRNCRIINKNNTCKYWQLKIL